MIIIIPPPTHFGLVTSLWGWRKQAPHPLPPPDAAVKMRLGQNEVMGSGTSWVWGPPLHPSFQ